MAEVVQNPITKSSLSVKNSVRGCSYDIDTLAYFNVYLKKGCPGSISVERGSWKPLYFSLLKSVSVFQQKGG